MSIEMYFFYIYRMPIFKRTPTRRELREDHPSRTEMQPDEGIPLFCQKVRQRSEAWGELFYNRKFNHPLVQAHCILQSLPNELPWSPLKSQYRDLTRGPYIPNIARYRYHDTWIITPVIICALLLDAHREWVNAVDDMGEVLD